MLRDIRDVLRRHKALHRFGVFLIHKHFDVADDEEMTECTEQALRTLTIVPRKAADIDRTATIATNWVFTETEEVSAACCTCARNDQATRATTAKRRRKATGRRPAMPSACIMRHHTLVFILLSAFGIPALAADIGECAAAEAMTAMLKAEDQHSILSAQLLTRDKHLYGFIVTMSADRKSGYLLKADRPLGDRAGQICVYNRMADVRLFDARKPGVPPQALLKASDADASRRCDELARDGKVVPRGACGFLNAALHRGEAYGDRVALQGFLTRKAANGTYVPDGTLATVTGRIGGSINDIPKNSAAGIVGGILYSSLPEGASVINATLVYVDYTDYALAALNNR